jgi:hypothetical protein
LKLPNWSISLIGKLAIWSTLFLLGYFSVFLFALVGMIINHKAPAALESLGPAMPIIALILIPTVFITMIMQLIFLIHALRNSALPEYKRVLWALAIFLFMGIIVMPIYWYKYIYPEHTENG